MRRGGYGIPAAALIASAVIAGCGGGGGGPTTGTTTGGQAPTGQTGNVPPPPTAAGPPSTVGTTPPRSPVAPSPSKSPNQSKPKQNQVGGGLAPGTQAGQKVFISNSCGSCHAFKAAGAAGAAEGGVGPNLDTAPPQDAKKAGMPLQAFIKQSIVAPNSYIAPGFRANLMPSNFGKKLSSGELNSLVNFLVKNGAAGK